MAHNGRYAIWGAALCVVILGTAVSWAFKSSPIAMSPYPHPHQATAKFRAQLVDPAFVSRIMFGGGPAPMQQQWSVPPQLALLVAHQIITLLERGVPLRVHLPVPNRPYVQHVPYYVILYLTNGQTVALVSATHDPWTDLNVPLQQIPNLVTYTNQHGRMRWLSDTPLYQWLIRKDWTKYLHTKT